MKLARQSELARVLGRHLLHMVNTPLDHFSTMSVKCFILLCNANVSRRNITCSKESDITDNFSWAVIIWRTFGKAYNLIYFDTMHLVSPLRMPVQTFFIEYISNDPVYIKHCTPCTRLCCLYMI